MNCIKNEHIKNERIKKVMYKKWTYKKWNYKKCTYKKRTYEKRTYKKKNWSLSPYRIQERVNLYQGLWYPVGHLFGVSFHPTGYKKGLMDTKDWNILLVICLVSPFHPTGYKKGLMDTKDSNILLVICLVSPFHPHEGDFRNYFCIQAPPTHAPKRGAGHPVYTVRNKNVGKKFFFLELK